MALELAAGGAAVVVNVRQNRAEAEAVVKEIEAKGGKAMVALADVVDAAAVNAMAEGALEQFGRIDYLINNAALREEKGIEHMTFEEWRHIIGVMLDGAFHCVKACLDAIKKSDAGSIINVGGLTGAMGAPDRVHVVTAKAGIAGFTRGLAMELAPAQDHRQHAGSRHAGEARQAERNPAASDLPAAARPRRLAGRLRAAGALPGRPRRALHHRPDHQRQRRDVFRLTAGDCGATIDHASAPDLVLRHRGHSGPADRSAYVGAAGSDRRRLHSRAEFGWDESWVGYLTAANVVGALFTLTAGIGIISRLGGVRALQWSLLIGAGAPAALSRSVDRAGADRQRLVGLPTAPPIRPAARC